MFFQNCSTVFIYLPFHTHFSVILFISIVQIILLGFLGRSDIFPTLGLLIHDHSMSLHLSGPLRILLSALCSFIIQVLYILSGLHLSTDYFILFQQLKVAFIFNFSIYVFITNIKNWFLYGDLVFCNLAQLIYWF